MIKRIIAVFILVGVMSLGGVAEELVDRRHSLKVGLGGIVGAVTEYEYYWNSGEYGAGLYYGNYGTITKISIFDGDIESVDVDTYGVFIRFYEDTPYTGFMGINLFLQDGNTQDLVKNAAADISSWGGFLEIGKNKTFFNNGFLLGASIQLGYRTGELKLTEGSLKDLDYDPEKIVWGIRGYMGFLF